MAKEVPQENSATVTSCNRTKASVCLKFPSYLSTSANPNLEAFKGNLTLKIEVPQWTTNAYSIKANQSQFPDEDEVLFPPWSAFEVMSKERVEAGCIIGLKAWDTDEAEHHHEFNGGECF